MNDPEDLIPFPLSIENVAFVDEDESKRRTKKNQPYTRERTDSDEIVLFSPLSLDEEDDERNPLLGKSPNRGHAPAYHLYGQQQQYPQPGPRQYYGGYSGQMPPPPPQGYPMQSIQYYDYNTGQIFMAPPQSPMMQPQSPMRRPPHPPISKPYYSESHDGAVHPLKRSHVAPYLETGREAYEIDIMIGKRSPLVHGRNLGYGAVSSAPPRSAKLKEHSPRLSDPTQPRGTHHRVSSDKPTGERRRASSDHLQDPAHHRASSDRLVSDPRDRLFDARHRRDSSADRLPPMDPRRVDRPRSFSAGGKLTVYHQRGSSLSEVSVGTSASHVSIVSDISKSARFRGKTESGKVQLRFPYENVRLRIDDALPPGYFYKQYITEEDFEDYHLNDEMNGPWEIDEELACNCTCHNCSRCTARQKVLPPPSYVLNVEGDLYRRVLDEVSASKRMPCGLFFCGHHEDVSQPSVLIAIVIVVMVLGAMIVAAIMLP